MSRRPTRLPLIALFVAALVAAASAADVRPSRRDADLMKQKVVAITQFGTHPGKQPLRTTVTETEVNAYLLFDSREDLPAGVVEPSVTILGGGRVSGRAVVDLDAVRKERKPTSLLDPMNYLGGRVPLTATGVLTSSNGMGRFALESAAVGSIPIPKLVLQEIVSYYSRTPEKPAGLGLDEAFRLPAGIREIHVERGQAVVVQ